MEKQKRPSAKSASTNRPTMQVDALLQTLKQGAFTCTPLTGLVPTANAPCGPNVHVMFRVTKEFAAKTLYIAGGDNGDVVVFFMDRDNEQDLVIQPPKGLKLVADDPNTPENDNQTGAFILKLGKAPKAKAKAKKK